MIIILFSIFSVGVLIGYVSGFFIAREIVKETVNKKYKPINQTIKGLKDGVK